MVYGEAQIRNARCYICFGIIGGRVHCDFRGTSKYQSFWSKVAKDWRGPTILMIMNYSLQSWNNLKCDTVLRLSLVTFTVGSLHFVDDFVQWRREIFTFTKGWQKRDRLSTSKVFTTWHVISREPWTTLSHQWKYFKGHSGERVYPPGSPGQVTEWRTGWRENCMSTVNVCKGQTSGPWDCRTTGTGTCEVCFFGSRCCLRTFILIILP